MVSSKDFVLITGATGHVGSCTLLHLLRTGYRVRAAVRSQSKAATVLSWPQVQALNPGSRLSFTVVPDITCPGAYDDAMQDITHVIHIASPLATGSMTPAKDHDAYFIQPAVRGTRSLLEAADGCGTVRRVVITGSLCAIAPTDVMEGLSQPSGPPVGPDNRLPMVKGPYRSEFAAYAASKVASLHQAETWVEQERPAFDVVYLHPSFVIGRNDSATTTTEAMKGTNAVVLAMLLGKRYGPYAGASVHVEDVARVHVAALDPTIMGNQSYILSSPAMWNDAMEITRRALPDEKWMIPGGSVDSTNIPIDASLTEDTFGFKFTSFEEQVKSTVCHFIELRQKRMMSPRKRANTGRPVGEQHDRMAVSMGRLAV